MTIYPSGVYKDNDTDIPDYTGCSDSLSIKDSNIIYDKDISQAVESYFPESVQDTEFGVFTELLKKVATQIDGNSNFITECYNLENLDEDMTYKLSSIYDISYPLYYNVDRLKFLVKNYEKIRNERGTEKSLYMLFRVLERSESELYENDFDDTIITKVSKGYYKITNSRIQDTDFAIYMARKVTRSGIYYEVNNISDSARMTANTTITSNYHYDSSSDELGSKDDRLKSDIDPFITDRDNEFTRSYDY